MILSLYDKKQIVSEVRGIAQQALALVIADLTGITVNESCELRAIGRLNKVYMRVVRNTLVSKILYGTSFDCLKEVLVGSVLLAFSTVAPRDAARVFEEFAEKHDKFKIKLAIFNGLIIEGSHIGVLSNLPTYLEAISKFAMIIQEVALVKIVRLLYMICEKKKI